MKQVLLIEPDKLLAQTYVKALESAKISANWQPDAQDAITDIDTMHPKLVILELQLAEHNGVEFLYELRSHSDLQRLPIILHTIIPRSDLHLSEQVQQQLGIVAYLYKPQTTLQDLIKAAQKELDQVIHQ